MARFNKTAHLRQNIDAIKAAFTLDREKREASPEEKEILQAYSGFGAIKEVIDPLPKDGGKNHTLNPSYRRTAYRPQRKHRQRKRV